jgi:hypothetical protein
MMVPYKKTAFLLFLSVAYTDASFRGASQQDNDGSSSFSQTAPLRAEAVLNNKAESNRRLGSFSIFGEQMPEAEVHGRSSTTTTTGQCLLKSGDNPCVLGCGHQKVLSPCKFFKMLIQIHLLMPSVRCSLTDMFSVFTWYR